MILNPECSSLPGNEQSLRFGFERFVARDVTTAETERCLLDVDCSDRAAKQLALDAMSQCLADGSPQVTGDIQCTQRCDDTLRTCGADTDCGVDVVATCFHAREICRQDRRA